MTNAEKINLIRKVMLNQYVNGFIVPQTDEYLGEYISRRAERLNWLTGFTGSAGVAVVLENSAVVMSDGRYTIQLADEVDNALYALENSQKVKLSAWLTENAGKEAVIGYDPKLHTAQEISSIEEAGVTLKAMAENLIDLVWADQPAAPISAASLFPENIGGVSATEKIQNLQVTLEEEGADYVLLTKSDSIAWLLNIRGNDLPFIPVCLSYAVVPAQGKVKWFVHADKVSNEVREALKGDVEILEEDQCEVFLKDIKSKVWLDEKRSSIYFKNILQVHGSEILNKEDPCLMPRACKNKVEQEAMKRAHIRDGIAVTKFLKWFEENAVGQDELSVEKKLEEFRAQAPEFKEPSFSTIAGFGANGAIVHYRATEKTNKKIEEGNLLLLDSGAQYSDGTTDITRTIAVGEVSNDIKEKYTLVLKGHIALASAVFKKGTLGKEIDALARQFLREKGLDYAHGTGHGVGCYLSVHEEAASISPLGERALEAGMIISNEPGYYEEGAFGIRIENLVLVKEVGADELCFETITLAPMDESLVVKEMLTDQEIEWLDDYHERVRKTIY